MESENIFQMKKKLENTFSNNILIKKIKLQILLKYFIQFQKYEIFISFFQQSEIKISYFKYYNC